MIARQEMRLYVCVLHKACKMLLEVIIHSPIFKLNINSSQYRSVRWLLNYLHLYSLFVAF